MFPVACTILKKRRVEEPRAKIRGPLVSLWYRNQSSFEGWQRASREPGVVHEIGPAPVVPGQYFEAGLSGVLGP